MTLIPQHRKAASRGLAPAKCHLLLFSAVSLAAFLGSVSAPASAQGAATVLNENGRWVFRQKGSIPLRGARELKFEASGSILIRGGHPHPGEVAYTLELISDSRSETIARRDFGKPRYVTESAPGSLAAAFVGFPEGRAQVRLTLVLPDDLPVFKLRQLGGATEMRSVHAKVYNQIFAGQASFEDLHGGLVVFSGGGELRARNIGGDIEISSGAGNIDIRDARGGVRCELGSGSIRVRSVAGPVELSTGGGNVSAEDLGSSVYATTQGGLLEIVRARGPVVARNREGILRVFSSSNVQAYAVTGPIQARDLSGEVNLSTAGGNIYAQFSESARLESSRLLTEAGDITVRIPERLSLTVVAESGCRCESSIVSDYKELASPDTGYAGSASPSTAKAALNGGGPTLRLVSYAGRVVVQRSR